MRQIFLIALTLFSLGFGFKTFARAVYVDNKEICETTKGNWRLFNNECANSCANKFDALLCAKIPTFACDCGVNRCWDGDKCVADKVARIPFDARAIEARKKREAELKEFNEKMEEFNKKMAEYNAAQAQLAQQANPNQDGQNRTPQQSTNNPAPMPAVAMPTLPEQTAPAPVLDAQAQKKNDEQKQICEQQNGTWEQFKNGCVDNCGSKIAKVSMCPMSITMGCRCGGSKCWNPAKSSCIEMEDYKALLSQMENAPEAMSSNPELPMPNLDIKQP